MNMHWSEKFNTQTQQEELKRRFNYEAWSHQDPTEARAVLRNISLSGIGSPDWSAYRIQRMTTKDFPPYVRSIWQSSTAGTEVLVRVDLYECDSIQAAREFLLRLLGEFQSNQIVRREGMVGDVAFSYPGDTMVLFSRSNIVTWLRNAGPKVVSVTFLAKQFDTHLLSLLEL
jgi:hypothetical protein